MSTRRSEQEILADLGAQDDDGKKLGLSFWRGNSDTTISAYDGSNDEQTLVSFEPSVPVDLDDGGPNRPAPPMRIALPAHETFTDDGNANQQTLTLNHDLYDAPSTESVVVFEGGTRVQPDSTDFDNDAVTITTSGNGNTIDVFYTSTTSAIVRLQKRTPKGSATAKGTLYERPLNMIHSAPQFENPELLSFSDLFEGMHPEGFRFSILVKAPYSVRLTPIQRTNGRAKPTNALLSVPVRQGTAKVPGLARLVAQKMMDI